MVKLTGDGALVEFASVVDAVRCAVEIQRSIAVHNADLEPEQRIEFRIGINLGDVIIDGDDIYGDGVNIAARLEGLAPPVACASRMSSIRWLAAGWMLRSRTWASSRSRTSRSRCASGSGSMTPAPPGGP